MKIVDPKITVLMSAYNGEGYLKETIESILNQTFTDFEFLIIDDGSTDKTANILKEYKNKDKRIKIVTNKKNLGLTRSLNKGLKFSKGEYIARMDGDDVSCFQRLKKQLGFIKKNKCSVVGSWAALINQSGKIVGHNRKPNSYFFIKWGLLFGSNPFPHPSAFFKKEAILKVGGYNKKFDFSQDLDLWSRLSKRYKIGILEEKLIKLRLHKKAVSQKFNEKQVKNKIKVSKKNVESLLGKKLNIKEANIWTSLISRKKLKTKRDLLPAFLLLRKIYKKFIEKSKPSKKAISLIKKDIFYKILNLLNTNLKNRLGFRKKALKSQ